MVILAHRGYSAKFFENTLTAFKKAFEFGADGVELDLRSTRDNQIVVVHDDNLERFCGINVKISDLNLRELREYNREGEKIPSFEEVLSIIPPGKILNVELKERTPAESALQAVRKLFSPQNTIVSSFDHDLISFLIKRHPDFKFGFLVGEELRNDPIGLIRSLLEEKPYSIHLPVQLVDYPQYFESICTAIKSKKVDIYIYTVNDPDKCVRFVNMVDGIITDEVEKFVTL